ncbi:MAG: cupin domain-containing protein [Actinomycetota bacterium]|nr:cupin domain-containing protein [Actinomycetota bacterium]
MGASKTVAQPGHTDPSTVERETKEKGLDPRRWSNGPHDTYDWHSHSYHKVLYCLRGSIVFHTRENDYELRPGDRLDVEPGTEHAATVGPEGVECVEAAT